MACFCFGAPQVEESGPKHDASLVTNAVTKPTSLERNASAGKQSSTAADKQVDRESPVSVLSGPGDDVSSDKRRSNTVDDRPQHAANGKQSGMEHGEPRQQQQQQQQQQEHKQIHQKEKQQQLLPAHQPGQRRNSAKEEQRHKEGAQEQEGREKQFEELPKSRMGHPPKQASQQQQQQQLEQRQQQMQQPRNVSYAASLPGRPRILAWLYEADLTYATVNEVDNTPYSLSGDSPLPHSFGRFHSCLPLGEYDELSEKLPSQEAVAKRSLSRASQSSTDLASSSERAVGASSSSHLQIPKPHPHVASSRSTEAVGGSSHVASHVASSMAGQGADATGVLLSGGGGLEGSTPPRETSLVMHALLRKTATLLRQRSLDTEGRSRMAGVAAALDTSANFTDKDAAEAGAGSGDGLPAGLFPSSALQDDKGESSGRGGQRSLMLFGASPAVSGASRSVALNQSFPVSPVRDHDGSGAGGSFTDEQSGVRAATGDALSELGSDSTPGEVSPHGSPR